MSRITIPIVFVFAAASVLLGSFLFGPTQDSGRTLSASLASSTPETDCRFGSMNPDSSIVVVPADPFAEVYPAAQFITPPLSTTPIPGSQLALTFVTFPPGSHDDMHSHAHGARMIYLQSGAIEYMTADDTLAQAAWHHRPGEIDDGEEVLDNTWVSVEAGEWITEDKGVCHAFQNVSDTDAILVVAEYAIFLPAPPICFGGCRERGP
jgi:quercetin dioxygenase-like cupin family protein